MSTPRRALVTGAAGFVGANLVRTLAQAGHNVTAVSRPGGDDWRLRQLGDAVRLIAADLRDDGNAAALIDAERPEWVFHVAAHGAYSWQRDTMGIMRSNVLATAALADAAADAGCEAFVHAGSSSEYGRKDHAPREDEPAEPNSAYAVAKLAATEYCRHLGASGQLPAVTLRLYSVYGPWEDPRRLMPALIAHGLAGNLPPLAKRETARDYVLADDVSAAFLAAAASADRAAGRIYNIGTGHQTTLEELVALARRQLPIRAEPEWESTASRSWDTDTWVSDPGRAHHDLGWRAQTSLDEGFAGLTEWLVSAQELHDRYGIRS